MDIRDQKESEEESYARLPPKLREKLEATRGRAEMDEFKPSSPLPMIMTVVVVIALVGGGIFWLSSTSKKNAAKAAVQAHQDSLRAVAEAESTAIAARADSIARAAADSVAAKTASAKPKPAKATPPASTGATASRPAPKPAGDAAKAPPPDAPAPAPSPSSSGFGIEVASYLFEDRANQERDKLAGTTGLPAMVAPKSSGGFRVILGKFSSRASAEKKATALVDSSLVAQAKVVARPK